MILSKIEKGVNISKDFEMLKRDKKLSEDLNFQIVINLYEYFQAKVNSEPSSPQGTIKMEEFVR